MRRETDFIFEKAPWPALLLEEGAIRRANGAASHFFGETIQGPKAMFSSVWAEGNALPISDLLKDPNGGIWRVKLVLVGGEKGDFLAHLFPLVRDGHPYLLLQLFKASEGHSGVAVFAPPPAPVSPAKAAPVAPVLPVAPVPESPAASQTPPAAGEAQVYKQKLDCALQLARSISLDFNNALTSILGHASLLLGKAESGHPWRSSLVEIEKSSARAAEIASDLANFSRQEKESRGQGGSNINSLLEKAVEGLKAEYSGVNWSFQFERKLYTATADEVKIQQAFVKVLENAAQATDSKGQITLQTRNMELTEAIKDGTVKLNPGNYVCIEISDNGQGIAADVLPRIFEPFFTTKGKNHRGLGLVWVYGILTNHGGGVAVSSEVAVGTSVRIYLPANKKIVKEVSIAGDDLRGNQTILIVDDEDLLLTMGQMILSSFGYTVLTANGGQKALEVFNQAKSPINLMITDLVMPNMSGRELTEHVQRISPATRILWSSGYVRSESSEGHRTYLQKPFTSQDLLRKVKEVLAV